MSSRSPAGTYGQPVNIGKTFDDQTSRPLVLHFDGKRWTQVKVPQPASGAGLTGIAARTSSDIWAVGSMSTADYSAIVPFALHFDGTTWRQVAPLAAPGNSASLDKVRSPARVWRTP